MEYFRFLPSEITSDILSRVPTESVLECKSVCKNWRSLVRHPSFSKMHLDRLNRHNSGKLGFLASTSDVDVGNDKFHYYEYNENHGSTVNPIERMTRFNLTLPFERIRFIGSLNGLICFTSRLHVYICNPVTKEYVMLPEIKRDCDRYIPFKYGFGYLSSTDEYKVAGIYLLTTKFAGVYIYTLGSGNGWRNLGHFNLGITETSGGPVMFANGALYWKGFPSGVILTFDLFEEKFCEYLLPPPKPPQWNSKIYDKIGVLNGFLFYAAFLIERGVQMFDVWLLRKKNDSHDMKEQEEEYQSWVWSKEFRVGINELLAITTSGSVLTFNCKLNINIHDTAGSSSKTLRELKKQFRRVYSHENTLISLEGLGEEHTKMMKSLEGDRKV